MSRKGLLVVMLTATAWLLVGTARSSAQGDKVFRSVSNEQLEVIFKSLGIQAKKTPAKTGNATFFDFDQGRYKIRLSNFDGKDLMLDAFFPRAPWEALNDWNRRAKFSRAALVKDGDREMTTLESNLDCLGGVTENIVKQFLRTFDDELKSFDRHLSAEVGLTERIYPAVGEELLEKILKDLKADFKKIALKNNQGFTYEFMRGNFTVRLHNYNGKDLMIDAQFKKAPLEKINKWNNTRKFVRAVFYQTADREYSALEANLDCVAGVSESMIRYFIVNFDPEVRDFAKFLEKE